ncbi:zinc-binding dehydrogenase [Streptomyces sp. NPDC102490]|uniref:zinc-binding dehydrogenase n=1 Tax=Streptomyces sp. NPDC102490 TaxID=3366183 RepID=UPI00381DE2D2
MSSPGSEPAQKGPRWTREQLDRRNRRLGHAGIARAQDILARRYRLECADAAFELLKTSSQQSNVKLHTLADAVVRTPAPDQDATSWFAGRGRFSPPRLPGLRLDAGSRHSQGAVLKATLHRLLTITQTPMGNVQLAESGRLHLARHTGLNRYFTDFFAFVETPTTLCAQAASAGVLVNGAGGAVGGYAVQLAKKAGAHVIATASPRSREAVASAGADEVVDHTTTGVTAAVTEPVDLALNLAPVDPAELAALVTLVRPGGVLVNTTVWMPAPGDEERGVRGIDLFVRSDADQLGKLVALIDGGELHVAVTERVALSELPALHARAAEGSVHGKVVVLPPAA